MRLVTGVLPIPGGLLALAVGAGFVGALSGLGGGVFIVPCLVIFARLPMHVAIGASLISVVATSAGASVAYVRDGWTNLRVAMLLECATVTGAVTGAYLTGVIPASVLELLFALVMLQSAYFSTLRFGDDINPRSDYLCERLQLAREIPGPHSALVHYGVVNLPSGFAIMLLAGLTSALLRIGSGVLTGSGVGYLLDLALNGSRASTNFCLS